MGVEIYGLRSILVQILLYLPPDGIGQFYSDGIEAGLVLSQGPDMLGGGRKYPKVGLDTALDFFAEHHILVEHVLDGGDDPVIDGPANGAVGDKALEGLAFEILLPNALFDAVEINAVHDLKIILLAQYPVDHILCMLEITTLAEPDVAALIASQIEDKIYV